MQLFCNSVLYLVPCRNPLRFSLGHDGTCDIALSGCQFCWWLDAEMKHMNQSSRGSGRRIAFTESAFHRLSCSDLDGKGQPNYK